MFIGSGHKKENSNKTSQPSTFLFKMKKPDSLVKTNSKGKINSKDANKTCLDFYMHISVADYARKVQIINP